MPLRWFNIYFAGFFDGEGYIGIVKRSSGNNHFSKNNPYYSLEISITNTNKEVLYKIKSVFGGYVSKRTTQRGKGLKSYIWRTTSLKAKKCIEIIFPYLIVKKDQAILGIDFQSNLTKYKNSRPVCKVVDKSEIFKRKKQYLKMKELKKCP